MVKRQRADCMTEDELRYVFLPQGNSKLRGGQR